MTKRRFSKPTVTAHRQWITTSLTLEPGSDPVLNVHLYTKPPVDIPIPINRQTIQWVFATGFVCLAFAGLSESLDRLLA